MFPKNFLWGAATSSHQVEGNNTNNDWWLWEQEGKTKEPSGQAARHYELFHEDFQTAKTLGHNAHRFSIEWSRIEPQEGQVDHDAINHYIQVIRSLKAKSIEPIVTLHHFTNPVWFSKQGGWLNPQASHQFARYVEKIIEAFHQEVRYWITINEPMVLVFHGYLTGQWPPGQKNPRMAWQVVQNLIWAHRTAYQMIHKIYARHGLKKPMVGIAKNLRPFEVCPHTSNLFYRFGAWARHFLFNCYFLNKTQAVEDFIGVNYYEREFVNQCRDHSAHLNQMGWASYPEGLLKVCQWMKKYHKPILITENGTAEDDDEMRWCFMADHLKQLEKGIEQGLPIIGYLYWSFLDNFEWHHGFDKRFGLIEVDYQTFERRVRPSALRFRDVIQRGRLPDE